MKKPVCCWPHGARVWLSRKSRDATMGDSAVNIAGCGLQLSVSALGRWSRWITPASMTKRFDTYFFVVPVAPDQDCRPDNQETVHGMWIDPSKALVQNSQGVYPLSPPTLVTLYQLLDYKDIDHLIAESHRRPWPAPFKTTNGQGEWPGLDHRALGSGVCRTGNFGECGVGWKAICFPPRPRFPDYGCTTAAGDQSRMGINFSLKRSRHPDRISDSISG